MTSPLGALRHCGLSRRLALAGQARWRAVLILMMWIVLACCGTGYGRQPAMRHPLVPAQFIVKQYSEGLGRAPTAAEWRQATQLAARAGVCTLPLLRRLSTEVYLSRTFASLGYDRVTALSALVRGALNRDLDSGLLKRLNSSSLSWAQVARRALGSREFSS